MRAPELQTRRKVDTGMLAVLLTVVLQVGGYFYASGRERAQAEQTRDAVHALTEAVGRLDNVARRLEERVSKIEGYNEARSR